MERIQAIDANDDGTLYTVQIFDPKRIGTLDMDNSKHGMWTPPTIFIDASGRVQITRHHQSYSNHEKK